MKNRLPRRSFLRNSLAVTTAITLFPSHTADAFASEESPFKGYNPHAAFKNDMRRGLPGSKSVSIYGKIFDRESGHPVSGVSLEVWHLSPDTGTYRHHGKLVTDERGYYRFISDFPQKEAGKNARIFFRISCKDKTSFTELLINRSGAHITAEHWKEHRALEERLFPVQRRFLNHSHIRFNLSV
ncbi:hypothetical protein GWK08_19000 [Leptobacterium flavescens]|uniref:Intradiol ring-cleavage dioxygenases domain-containing protein n=1 Tax=Leptobacterium flavescens TaxID=472055 RepID=A0A6P0USN7_9FLAO|nr:hypothetical protein [Leptobacterium flavescens]NER15550.1 hypothetical protein [Leptobacterium flavescens]